MKINYAKGRKYSYDNMLMNYAEKSLSVKKQRKFYAHNEGGQ